MTKDIDLKERLNILRKFNNINNNDHDDNNLAPPPPLPPLPPPPPPPPAFSQNLGDNSFLPNLDNDENNDLPIPTSQYRSNFNKGIALTEAEPIALTTTGTQTSVTKIEDI